MTTCDFCGDAIGGGPGGWFSLKTTMERCVKSPTAFHEPRPDPRTMAVALRYISRPTTGLSDPATDPADFALHHATEQNVRIALAGCIRIAQQALRYD